MTPEVKLNFVELPTWIESWAGPINGRNGRLVWYQYIVVSMLISLIIVFLFSHTTEIKPGWIVVLSHVALYFLFRFSYRKPIILDDRVRDIAKSLALYWITQVALYCVIFFVACFASQEPNLIAQLVLSGLVGFAVFTPITARSMRRAREAAQAVRS
jgi:hypothetical protein